MHIQGSSDPDVIGATAHAAACPCRFGSHARGMATARVLSDAVNNAVVQIEGRRCPGLVVQGDRLKESKRLAQVATEESVAILAEELSEAVAWYDDVSRRAGLPTE